MSNQAEREAKRLEAMSLYEKEAIGQGYLHIAGIDEVGRGCIAGPVVSAAVILPPGEFIAGVNDSKKLSPKKRLELAAEIKRRALAWAVACIFPPYLDSINILNATRETMAMAVGELLLKPDYLLIDALSLPDINIKQQAIIKGDSLRISIASASIVAKVERDRLMENLDLIHPVYGFGHHKGYATREHLQALLAHGPCSMHRVSFEPVRSLQAGGLYAEQPSLFDQFST